LYLLQACIYTADEPNKNTEIDEGKKKNEQISTNKRQATNKKIFFFVFLLLNGKKINKKKME